MPRRRQDLPFRRPLQQAAGHRQLRIVRHRFRRTLTAHQPPFHDHRLRSGVRRTVQHDLHHRRHGPVDVRDEEHGEIQGVQQKDRLFCKAIFLITLQKTTRLIVEWGSYLACQVLMLKRSHWLARQLPH